MTVVLRVAYDEGSSLDEGLEATLYTQCGRYHRTLRVADQPREDRMAILRYEQCPQGATFGANLTWIDSGTGQKSQIYHLFQNYPWQSVQHLVED